MIFVIVLIIFEPDVKVYIRCEGVDNWGSSETLALINRTLSNFKKSFSFPAIENVPFQFLKDYWYCPYYSGKCRTVGTYSPRRNHGRATASRQTEKTVDTRH